MEGGGLHPHLLAVSVCSELGVGQIGRERKPGSGQQEG